jgi:hypothetical protein
VLSAVQKQKASERHGHCPHIKGEGNLGRALFVSALLHTVHSLAASAHEAPRREPIHDPIAGVSA